ncbi:Imm49 family immunity protein [Streptomyces sp. NPDC020742]|uniref:Imm49 family immunity protein n=1 Tax=Streptomyces sp. NPDC020742 TaxID=3154897 RepID=UPI0033E8D87F
MQVGSAVFAAATTTEARVQCRIAHQDRILQATGPQWYVHPNAWLTAFYVAVVCRERDRITALRGGRGRRGPRSGRLAPPRSSTPCATGGRWPAPG